MVQGFDFVEGSYLIIFYWRIVFIFPTKNRIDFIIKYIKMKKSK